MAWWWWWFFFLSTSKYDHSPNSIMMTMILFLMLDSRNPVSHIISSLSLLSSSLSSLSSSFLSLLYGVCFSNSTFPLNPIFNHLVHLTPLSCPYNVNSLFARPSPSWTRAEHNATTIPKSEGCHHRRHQSCIPLSIWDWFCESCFPLPIRFHVSTWYLN